MKNFMKTAFLKASMTLQKHAPEILVVSGVIGLVGAGVLACKETTKLDETLKKCNDRIDDLSDKMNTLDEKREQLPKEEQDKFKLSEKEKKVELARVYIRNAADVAKLYLPSIILAIASVTAVLGGFGILKKRHAAVVAAFGEMSAAYSEFKKRVKESIGDEKYREILDGVKQVEKEAVDDNGHNIGKVTIDEVNPTDDPYTFMFDETTSYQYFAGDPVTNEAFLKGIQAAANNKLNVYGVVWLKDVLEDLGIDIKPSTPILGWVKNPSDEHLGDDYIDFGIEEVDDVNTETMKFTRRYILHFNCDGDIRNTFEHAFEGDK